MSDNFSKGSCLTMAYDIEKSKKAKKHEGTAKNLMYGSAELEGYFYTDKVCPVKNAKCFRMQFLAIYLAKGIHKDTDGILGLSPMKDKSQNKASILLRMKQKGLIENAKISFSLSLKGDSFALFGGFDPKQIVGGSKNLIHFKNESNSLGTWSLKG
jgi:hypothetical protein